MDAGSLGVLRRLIARGGRSFLQYVSDSSPFETGATHAALAHIFAMAREERSEVGRLIRFLQKKHVWSGVLDSYPAYFTQMNFITVECLVPKLVEDAENQIAAIEKDLPLVADEVVRLMVQEYLDMKRRHLQTLIAALQPQQLPAS